MTHLTPNAYDDSRVDCAVCDLADCDPYQHLHPERTKRCPGSLRVVKTNLTADAERAGFDFAHCSECQQSVRFDMRYLGSIGYSKPFYSEHAKA